MSLPQITLKQNNTGSWELLSRAQQKAELPWVLDKIKRHIGYHAEVLNIDFGHDFLTPALKERGHSVQAFDLTQDPSSQLPYSNRSFDVVTALDVFDHVGKSFEVLQEVTRVLRPGGVLIFNNFNQTRLAWLLGVRSFEWFMSENAVIYHDYTFFQRPNHLRLQMSRAGLEFLQISGLRPVLWQRALLDLWKTGVVSENFQYCLCRRPWVSYIGLAQKRRFS